MNNQDGGAPDFEEQSRAASEMLERSLMKAVGSVETELTRVMRAGEADLDRLARRITETLAQLTVDSVFGNAGGGATGDEGAGSLNGIATAIARAAQRGSRFT
jgi:hypothetical protein